MLLKRNFIFLLPVAIILYFGRNLPLDMACQTEKETIIEGGNLRYI